MKKTVKKLRLTRETLKTLHLSPVSGGVSDRETMCGYTCIRQCQLVPSVDICP